MISLEKQIKTPNILTPIELLTKVLEDFGIEERGGGPEGIYYTHPLVDGEYLFRNLHLLIQEVVMRQHRKQQ